jgi:hypothetical protein
MRGLVTLVIAGGLVAGCGMSNAAYGTANRIPVTPEVLELANMRLSNVVPKSSPAALVRSFEQFCLSQKRMPVDIKAALRSADYVEAPSVEPNGTTAFVVDDRRPMVILGDDGQLCAVGAQSRTGQTARIHRMINRRFPEAQVLEPASVSNNTEYAVRTHGAHGDIIFLQRIAPFVTQSRLILGIRRG